MHCNKYYNGVFVMAQRVEILNTLGIGKNSLDKFVVGLARFLRINQHRTEVRE